MSDDEPGNGEESSAVTPDAIAADDPTPEDLPVERRDVLKWGVAGALFHDSMLDSASGVGEPSTSQSTGGSGPRTVSMKQGARDYLPADQYPLSIRGIAPDKRTSQGSNVWVGSQQFSTKNLISEQGIDRRPVSLREIVTPQRQGSRFTTWGSGWENWLGDHEVPNGREYEMSGRKRLIQAVSQLSTGKFRGVGSGHSHSEAAKPRKHYTDVKGIHGDLPLNWLKGSGASVWKNVDKSHLVRLGAGTVLKNLNRNILPKKGLALPNMGSWDGQTLGGAINTSTHGTGIGEHTFADLVRSVEMVTVPESPVAQGESVVRMFRIEPSDGITDPETFGNHTDDHDMALIQDDEIFHSAVVGYGSLGVVYAYTLEVDSAYWLHETKSFTTLQQLNLPADARKHTHYSLRVDMLGPQLPPRNNPPNPACMVITRNPAKARGRTPTERVSTTEFFEDVFQSLLDRVTGKVRSLSVEDVRKLTGTAGSLSGVSDDAFEKRKRQPNGVGIFEKGRNETASYIALRRTKDKYPNSRFRKPEQPVNAITTEIAVPVDQVKPAIERIIQVIRNDPRLQPSPLGVRFTAGSPHKFSPEYKRETAMLEFIVPVPEQVRTMFDKVENGPLKAYVKPKKILWQKIKLFFKKLNLMHLSDLGRAKQSMKPVENALINGFNGRPHLGKFNSVDVNATDPAKRPQNMFSEHDKWQEAFEYFNQFGTFDGAFSDNKARQRGNRQP